MSLKVILLIIAAYLLGSIPTAYIVGRRVKDLDITQHGSGNVGGTNALRVLGWGPAICVALIDICKALIPTVIAINLLTDNTAGVFLVALAAILGHNYSLYLRFRGGKGIATTVGACIVLFPSQTALLVMFALVLILATRMVSLGSIVLVLTLPLLLLWQKATGPELSFATAVALLGTWRHRANIQRLLNGTENRLGNSKN